MPLFVIALGALMLVGGLAALGLGLPYIVLESGFTQVIIGSVVATGGMVVLVCGLILRELRKGRPLQGSLAEPAMAGNLPAGLVLAGTALAGIGLAGTALGATGLGAAAQPEGEMADEAQAELPFGALGPTGDTLENTAEIEGAAALADTADLADTTPEETMPSQLDISGPENTPDVANDDDEAASSGTEPDTDAGIAAGVGALPPPGTSLSDAYDELRQSLKTHIQQDDAAAERDDGFGPQAEDDHLSARHELAREPDEEVPLAAHVAPGTPETPVASTEGIVSVRQIGGSTYTMFVNGTVRADTPDGERMFGSITELKAHLASGG